MILWTIPRQWLGEPVFIVAGGVSVETQPLHLLAGRRVIAVNSSYERFLKFTTPPYLTHVDLLVFGDERWWREHHKRLVEFPAPIVTTGFWGDEQRRAFASTLGKMLQLRNCRSEKSVALSDDPGAVPLRRTVLTAAMNIAYLMNGGAPIVLLGADGAPGAEGRVHHHSRYPWDQRNGCWAEQRVDLVSIAGGLKARGVSVINASPGSVLVDLWPVMELGAAIEMVEQRKAA